MRGRKKNASVDNCAGMAGRQIANTQLFVITLAAGMGDRPAGINAADVVHDNVVYPANISSWEGDYGAVECTVYGVGDYMVIFT